jgi:two-component sensor histidine kinase/ligand-binding sensor domain-containing protein
MLKMRGLYQRSLAWLILLVTLCLIVGPEPAAAEDRNIRFRRLGLEQGLSQEAVQAILQDSQGLIWLGTQEGLNRYDGYDVKVFSHDPEDPGSLSHDWIWDLFEDSRGNIWVGTDGGGLNCYHREGEYFSCYRHDPDDPNSISEDRIRVIGEDSKGHIWVGTHEKGLNRLDPDHGFFTRFRHDPEDPTSLNHDNVRAIKLDSRGNLWVGSDGGGLNRFDSVSGGFISYVDQEGEDTGLGKDGVRSICEDRSGRLWLGTYGAGIYRFDPDQETFTHWRHDPQDPGSPGNDRVRAIIEDADGVIWAGTDRGLSEWRPESGSFVTYRHDPSDPASLSDNRIISLCHDRGGVLWVGTFGGLNRWNTSSGTFQHVKQEPGSEEGLSSNVVTSFATGRKGEVWVGTYGGGLNRLRMDSGVIKHYSHQPGTGNSLCDDRVMSLLLDSRGQLWVGTFGGGLDRFDPMTNTFHHYCYRKDDERSLGANSVSRIFEDSAGTLWVGTYGGGLSRMDNADGRFTRFRHDPESPESLSDNRVLDIQEDADGALWVGTEGGGLNRFHPQEETFSAIRHDLDDPASLSNDRILTIHATDRGTLWIGTPVGLNRWDPQDRRAGRNRFTRYGKKDGLRSAVIYGILQDAQNHLWMSTNRGLSRFNPATGQFTNFDTTNGLQSNDFNAGAYAVADDGRMLFGGINGFNAFYPERIERNAHIPPVLFTDFLKLNKRAELGCPVSLVDEIVLTHRDHLVTFEFAALDFTAPEKNRYKYRMEGLFDEWIDIGNRRQATFTNLGPGTYTLRVIAANNDGVWNEDGASIRVKMIPPPWKTWWAYCLYVLLLGGIITGLYISKMRRIRARQQAVEDALGESQTLLRLLNSMRERDVSGRTVDQVVEDVVRMISGHFSRLRVSYSTIDPKGRLTVLRSQGPGSLPVLGSGGNGVTVPAGYLEELSSGNPMVVAEMIADGRLDSLRGTGLLEGVCSSVHVPLHHSNELTGILQFDSPEPRKWNGHEIINMSEASQFLTAAIKNAFIEDERRRAEQQMKNSLQEKETMLREIHHRVKNNMTVIHSLIGLQSEHLEEAAAVSIFRMTQNRINSMALIHDHLYHSGDLARIDFAQYIETLVSNLTYSFGIDPGTVRMIIEVGEVNIDLNQAVPCGLILNELVSNCFKYAFPDGRPGEVRISLTNGHRDGYRLVVRDDGVGIPEDVDFDTTESMGMQLVNIFTEQLEGTIDLVRDGGTEFRIDFPGTPMG